MVGAGHEDLTTTQRYMHLSLVEVEGAIRAARCVEDKCSPNVDVGAAFGKMLAMGSTKNFSR